MRLYFVLIFSLIYASSYAQDFNILNFGAKSDSIALNTKAIQDAIDAASVKGGRVIIPQGEFLSGTIYLKSNVELYVSQGAVLKGSGHVADYPDNKPSYSGAQTHMAHWKSMPTRALIYTDNQDNVAISGDGTIDGNGGSKEFHTFNDDPNRPKILMFVNCRNVKVENIYLTNAAFWLQHYFACDGVKINGIRVYNYGTHNTDGMDIDSKNVIISNCDINSLDDALCFKSDSKLLCENITVTNCLLASNCNPIKFGTASFGGFKNITISNCVIKKSKEKLTTRGKPEDGVTENVRSQAGMALEMVDGGKMENINISNIVMNDVITPIFIRLGRRKNPTGSVKNILISNIIANSESLCSSSITAVPGFYVENVMLKDIIINGKGEGTLEDVARILPEKETGYPECTMFGFRLPAYGLYVRHVRNITCENIQFNLRAKDSRPAIYMEDVEQARIQNCKFDIPENNQPLVRVNNVSGIAISNIYSTQTIPMLLEVNGAKTEKIQLADKWMNKKRKLASGLHSKKVFCE